MADPTTHTRTTLDAQIEALPPASRVEAVLMTTDRPMRDARIAEATGLSSADISDAISAINAVYDDTGRTFRITRVADGWQIMTRPDVAPVLANMLSQRQQQRLSQAALETLAIVAYRQPVMRAEIETIRGVASGEVLRGLLERRLIRIAGRAEELGRPMLYGTTRTFLRVFGLPGIDDLPDVAGLNRAPAYRPEPTDAETADEPAGAALDATPEPAHEQDVTPTDQPPQTAHAD